MGVRPIHVAAWREVLLSVHSVATVKLRLASLRGYFDWLVERQHVALNPAASVKSPKQSIAVGKTTCLEPAEVQALLAVIDPTRMVGLRDRALIGLMFFTFARIGAALAVRCCDLKRRSNSTWIALNEKGGKIHEMPLHPQAEEWIWEYWHIAQRDVAKEQLLFRSIDRRTGKLSSREFLPANAYIMVKKYGELAGLSTRVCNHTFRATGITAYLNNGGTLEDAAKLANHVSTRTTQLYDRRKEDVKLAEVRRISI